MTLRRIVLAWALGFGVLAVAVSLALIVTTRWQREAADAVVRDSASARLATEIELRLLTHNVTSNLFLATRDPRYRAARAAQEGELRASIEAARETVSTGAEESALRDLERRVEQLLEVRAALERSDRDVADVVVELAEPLERAERAAIRHRRINEAQVEAAHQLARRVDDLSTATGAAAAMALLGSLALLLVGLHRLVIGPLDAVRVAIRRSRTAERGPRVGARAPREIAEIARALDDMTSALEREHEDRLAFLGGVAHDLRTPLGALKMAVALAAGDHPGDPRLAIATRQIDRLARMVGDLLDAARAEAGELDLHVADVELAALAREAIELYRPTSAGRHDLELDAPDPVHVRGDAVRLEQVIGNLLTNAIKYSPDGGPVRVRVSRRADHAEIAVADCGIGIARHELEHLFSPFRRHPAARAVAPGAGLGLSVARRIVLAHGGTITVDSTPHVGTIFTVSLPLAPEGT